ncbi:MAG: asparagine synthase (glutamine-hydrolyzing) [Sphingomonadaceae bacterium]
MCGIAGVFTCSSQSVRRESLVAIRDSMASRGPDDMGIEWLADGRLGLAHRRLSIIDLSSAGRQPMTDEAGKLTIVYNGEIYNHPELRAELEGKGHRFRSHSDTETILALYHEMGRGMLPRLRGMFAFALWDARRQELLLARDTHGIKPLYYRRSSNFAFASQVKALLADPATERRINPVGAASFAIWGSVADPNTIVAGIEALPGGHFLVVDRDGRAGNPEPFLTLRSVIADGLNEPPLPIGDALRESVSAHLLADVPVGCFLSAGVDSGAILGLMRDAGAANPTAITLRFAEFVDTPRDEAPLASEAAWLYGADHQIHTIDAKDFSASLPQIRKAMDQPSIDGINSWFVSRAAARSGLKVAMSGLGGDELLAGYSTFSTVPRTHKISRLARAPIIGALARLVARRLFSGKQAHALDWAHEFAGAYLARRSMVLPEQVGQVVGADLAARGQHNPLPPLESAIDSLPENDIVRVSALESAQYMRNQLLRDSDWAGMAHSLEIRLPLVDRVLSRTMAAHLPTLAMGMGKQALASAPSTPLSDATLNRPKTGFGIPVERWAGGGEKAKLADGWASQIFTDYVADAQLSL